LGVGASTAGIYAVLGVIGNQYTTAINEGKSPDTAMFHAGASGGISGGIEIVGGGLIKQALKKPLAVLGKHVGKLATKLVTGFLKEGGEEFFQGISQIMLDFVTYGGKPPGSHDEEGNAQ